MHFLPNLYGKKQRQCTEFFHKDLFFSLSLFSAYYFYVQMSFFFEVTNMRKHFAYCSHLTKLKVDASTSVPKFNFDVSFLNEI